MLILFSIYFIYLLLYAVVSYAVLFHLSRYRVEGDISGVVSTIYITLSLVIIGGSLVFMRWF